MSNVMTLTPRNAQTRGADMIVKNGATFLMWDMGAGKTLTCILAMKRLGIPVLVLAPLNAATITWPDELDKWAPDINYIVLHGHNKKHHARMAHTYDVTILNFEGLIWYYKMVQSRTMKLRKYFVIWDESSMLKDHTTKRWEIMADAMPIYSPYRVALSGTPMPTTLVNLWAQYYLLDGGKRLTPEFYQFRNRYFDYTGPPRYITTLKPGAQEHIYDKVADITDRLEPEDHVELPAVVHNDVPLELPPKLRKLYNKLEEEFLLEFSVGDVLAGSSAVLHSKLRQFTQGGLYLERELGVPHGTPKDYQFLHDIKAKALKSICDTSVGKTILAPIQFRFEREIIEKVFKKKIPFLYTKNSRELVSQWNRGEIPLLLCHPRSVAYSLNLQFGGHTIVWYALPWEMDLYEQLIRRLRRSGQVSDTVFVQRLMFKNTVESDVVAPSLAIKNANQNDLFRGIVKRVQQRR